MAKKGFSTGEKVALGALALGIVSLGVYWGTRPAVAPAAKLPSVTNPPASTAYTTVTATPGTSTLSLKVGQGVSWVAPWSVPTPETSNSAVLFEMAGAPGVSNFSADAPGVAYLYGTYVAADGTTQTATLVVTVTS